MHLKLLPASTALIFVLSSALGLAQHKELKEIDVDKFTLLASSTQLKDEKSVGMVLLNTDGSKIAFGGLSKKLLVHEVATGKLLWSKSGSEYEPNTAVNLWALNMPLFALANNMFAGGKIFFLNWEDGSELGKMQPYARGKHGLAYGQPNKLMWFGPEHKLFGYSITDNKFITSTSGLAGHATDGNSLRYGPYQNLYSVSPDKKFLKWENDYNENTKMLTYPGGYEELYQANWPLSALALNPYIKGSDVAKAMGIYAALGENRGLVTILHVNGPKEPIVTFQMEDGFCGNLAFHTTDPDVLIATGKKRLIFYDWLQKKILRSIEFDSESRSFDLSLDGKTMAVGLSSGEVKVFRLGD